MRIVHFVHRYPPALGGAEAYFARLSRFLAAGGDEVTVHTTNALDLEAFWWKGRRMLPAGREGEEGVTVHRHAIRHWPLRRYQLKLLSLVPIRRLQCATLPCNPIAPTMWSVAGEMGPIDVVHATAFPYAFPILCGLRLALRRDVPFVLTPFLHLGTQGYGRDRSRRGYLSPPLRYLLRSADRVIVQTTLESDAVEGAGVAAERIVVQGMGVDPAECTGGDRAAARQRWGLPADAVVVGHLANKSVEKGTVDLLEAAQRAWQSGAAFHLLLAGPEMPNFVKYWRAIAGNPLTPGPSPPRGERGERTVVRLQELTSEEKRDFFAAIDVFAMPSRSDSFGIVFLEAWANGKPCVAYRAGGVAEVIRHEQDGLLADCGDVDALADLLARLSSDSALRAQLGNAGEARVLRENLWPEKLDVVRMVYRGLTQKKTSPPVSAGGLGVSR